MGISSIGPGSLLLIAIIVVVLFGTKRLRTVGEDIGIALKGLRKGLSSSTDDTDNTNQTS